MASSRKCLWAAARFLAKSSDGNFTLKTLTGEGRGASDQTRAIPQSKLHVDTKLTALIACHVLYGGMNMRYEANTHTRTKTGRQDRQDNRHGQHVRASFSLRED